MLVLGLYTDDHPNFAFFFYFWITIVKKVGVFFLIRIEFN